MTTTKGGSFYQDIQNLAVPFGLLLAAHGIGYASKRMSKDGTATPSTSSKQTKKTNTAQNGGAKKKSKS